MLEVPMRNTVATPEENPGAVRLLYLAALLWLGYLLLFFVIDRLFVRNPPTPWYYAINALCAQLVLFSLGTAGLTLGLLLFANGPAGLTLGLLLSADGLPPGMFAGFLVAVIQTVSFLTVGYFISSLMSRMRAQQAALTQANARL